MDLGLSDKVFLVTAASSGLGLASARQLVAEGARVVLVGPPQRFLPGVVWWGFCVAKLLRAHGGCLGTRSR